MYYKGGRIMKRKSLVSLVVFMFFATTLQASICNCELADRTLPKEERHEPGCPIATYMFLIEEDRVVYLDCLIKEGTTLVEVRAFAEALGATVAWDNAKKAATLTKEDASITLFLGKKEALVNGEEQKLVQAPTVYNERALYPVRFIAETFGYQVTYDKTNKYPFIAIYEKPEPLPVEEKKEEFIQEDTTPME